MTTVREAILPEYDGNDDALPEKESDYLDYEIRFFAGCGDDDEWEVLSSYLDDDGRTIMVDITKKIHPVAPDPETKALKTEIRLLNERIQRLEKSAGHLPAGTNHLRPRYGRSVQRGG